MKTLDAAFSPLFFLDNITGLYIGITLFIASAIAFLIIFFVIRNNKKKNNQTIVENSKEEKKEK